MHFLKSKKTWISFIILVFFSMLQLAFATETGGDIGTMAESVTKSFSSIGTLLIAAAYVAGFALTIAAIFKFKAHKDNPQQVPLGTAIALLVIGVLLVFLPTLFTPAGKTLFGEEELKAGENAPLPGSTEE